MKKRVDTRALAQATRGLLPAAVQGSVGTADLASRIEDLLYGDRGLAIALANSLITSEEASQAVAARIETWLVERSANTLQHGEWRSEAFVAAINVALQSADLTLKET